MLKSDFNANEWIIRKPNQFMYLMIPKNYRPGDPYDITNARTPDYLRPPNDYYPAIVTSGSKEPITIAETIIGLKIDHMEIISDKQMEPDALLEDPILQWCEQF